jgi:hypothetical protein
MGKHRHHKVRSSVSGGFVHNAGRAISAAYRLYKATSSAKGRVQGVRQSQNKRPRSKSLIEATYKHRKSSHVVEAIHGEIKRKFHKVVVCNAISKKCLRKDGWMLMQTYNVPLATLQSSEGTQQPSWVMSFATTEQLINNVAAPDLRSEMKNCIFDSNPAQSVIGGTLYTSVTAPDDDRIKLNRVKVTFEFSNQTTGPCLFDVYLVKSKQHAAQAYDPFAEWQKCLDSRAFGKGSPAFATSATAGGEGRIRTILPGVRPDNVPSWRKMFKILKHSEYELAANANVNETYFLHYGKIIERRYIKACYDQGLQNIAGLTCHLMVIQRGAIGVDVGRGTNKSANTACILGTQVAAICAVEYECQAVKQNRIKSEYVNPIQFYSNNVVADEKIINVVDTQASLVVNV